jgi:hypothetical protein
MSAVEIISVEFVIKAYDFNFWFVSAHQVKLNLLIVHGTVTLLYTSHC